MLFKGELENEINVEKIAKTLSLILNSATNVCKFYQANRNQQKMKQKQFQNGDKNNRDNELFSIILKHENLKEKCRAERK